jgi:putative adhesin
MRQVYDTPDGLEVALHIGAGDIDVEVRDTATTTVEIDGYEQDAPPTVRCEPAPGGGHRLTIEHRTKKKWFAIGRGLELRLVVPPATTIEGSSGAADLDANGTLGALSFKTGSGDVTLQQVGPGSVNVRAVSGDVEVGVRGGLGVWLDVSSTSGDVHSDLDGDGGAGTEAAPDLELTLNTVAGDITVERAGGH